MNPTKTINFEIADDAAIQGEGRPIAVQKKIVPQATYNKISKLVIARQPAK